VTAATGTLSAKQLQELADSGEVDTILCMFTDMQGRFMGKRVVPHFFFEEILGEEGLHACLYLLAIDMEMEPLPATSTRRGRPATATSGWCRT
jgi:glutamine synthetase